MTTAIAEFVANESPTDPVLPLMHGTDMYHFTRIGKKGALEPRKCPVFDEDLVYLFYGRPSYRVGSSSNPRRDLLYAPTCFVFKPQVVPNVVRIFPFDTGAYKEGLYAQYIHASMKIDDFLVGNSLSYPGQIVSAFFGNNDHYYHGVVRQGVKINVSAHEVQVYYNIVTGTGATAVDDRAYTIEIQSRDTIQIAGNLAGVVLPSSAMDDAEISDIVQNQWQVPFLTYHAFPGLKMRPMEYHGQVLERVYEMLRQGGYL